MSVKVRKRKKIRQKLWKKEAKLYVIGSLRNKRVLKIANGLRKLGFDVFDDWFAAGPEADDFWRKYEKQRGRTYKEALKGYAADHVFRFDLKHLVESDIAVLILPAGRSAHMELGFILGIAYALREFLKKTGKRGYILLDKPEKRWDVMYKFADGVFNNFDELKKELIKIKKKRKPKIENKKQ